jgi:hypothetical protein
MVDYKNAERIRQVYDQLSFAEQRQAYRILLEEFKEEEVARRKQHFDISLEPNTAWNEVTRRMLTWLQSGDSQPEPFLNIRGHAQDPYYRQEQCGLRKRLRCMTSGAKSW